ncbi:MAG: preprotein translocase subunit SecE [Minisyncoccia bacterium]
MMKSFIKYFKESLQELKKVNWPSKEETINRTIGVLFLATIIAIVFVFIDYLFIQLIRFIIK